MQYSIVNFKDLNTDFRIDAEYHKSDILKAISRINNTGGKPLSSYVDFIIGPFGSTVKTENYVTHSDYFYVRNKNIDNFSILDNDLVKIPEELYKKLKRFHIKEDDLLITVVGSLGKVAIATKKDTNSLFSCKSTILRSHSISPHYLLTYLNSHIGQELILRGKRGAIQEGLNLSDLKDIPVYQASVAFQELISNIILESFASSKDSKLQTIEAQDLLLRELNLLTHQPHHQLTFIRTFSDTQSANRFDAEYFQPKYDQIVAAIKNYPGGWAVLGSLVKFKKGIEVGSSQYLDQGIPFVRVSDISPLGLSLGQYISEELYSKLSVYQPHKDEILLSKDGSPGIAYHLSSDLKNMICSGGILRLKLKSPQVNPSYLSLVLNSLLVKEQMNRDVGGSIILHWRPDQIEKIIIPILSSEKQKQIEKKTQESVSLRNKALHLLESAKRAVEIAIEQDEDTAIRWLENQKNSNPE